MSDGLNTLLKCSMVRALFEYSGPKVADMSLTLEFFRDVCKMSVAEQRLVRGDQQR